MQRVLSARTCLLRKHLLHHVLVVTKRKIAAGVLPQGLVQGHCANYGIANPAGTAAGQPNKDNGLSLCTPLPVQSCCLTSYSTVEDH